MKNIWAAGLSIAFAAIMSFASCVPKPSYESTALMYIHLHTNIDTNEVDDSTKLYRDASGRHFGIATVQYFISNITMHNANGTAALLPNVVVLKNLDSEQYVVGRLPIGTYTSVSFDVGLDAAANSVAQTSFNVAGYVPVSSMQFGTAFPPGITPGYMFMYLQGMADTTAAQTGTNLVHFSYQIGSASNLKSVNMPVRSGALAPYTALANGVIYVHLIADFGKLLSVVDFKTQDSTNTYVTNPTLANTIAINIPGMFSYEE